MLMIKSRCNNVQTAVEMNWDNEMLKMTEIRLNVFMRGIPGAKMQHFGDK